MVLRQLRKSTQAGVRQQDRVSFDARAIKASEEDFFRTNQHLVNVLFNQKDAINVHDLIDLQYKFREDLWHYQFHTLEPSEKDDKISTAMLLSSKLSDLTGTDVEKFRLQVIKIGEELGDKDPGVSEQEFIAFQIFFNRMDLVKSKMFRRSFLDYDEFKDLFYEIVNSEDYVKQNKVKVSEHVCQSLFGLLDIDNSGELEPQEVLNFNCNMIGKPKDQQAKEDATKKAQDAMKKAKQFFSNLTGLKI